MKQKSFKSKLLIVGLSAVTIVAIVVVVAMFMKKNDESYRTIKVIETVGEVNVTKSTEVYAAYPGMVLEEGYKLETAEGSYIRLLLDEDKYVKIEAESKVTFKSLGLLGSNKTTIKIEQGAMTCEIVEPLEEDDDFIINTPNSVLAVRGTFFRVDLNYYGDGLVKTHVTTYGGVVAAQRVLSSGGNIGTEIDVSAGSRVTISQIDEGEDDKFIENVIFEKQDIIIDDIPDEDLIDIYFAIENGHEMFVGKETVREELNIRDIDIEEYISVYEKAEKIEENNSDFKESEKEEITTDKMTSEESFSQDESTAIPEEMTTESTTIPEETTTESTTIPEETTTESTTIPEEMTTESITVPEKTTEEITTKEEITTEKETTEEETTTEKPTTEHVHTEVYAGEVGVHKKCSDCGEVIEDDLYHSYTGEETLASTCTSKGEMKYTCTCGHTYTEEIDFLDHSRILGGEEEIHERCGSCGETLENGSFHEYEIEVTKTPTCEETGIRTYTCACGYLYTEDIPMEEHLEVGGGETGAHKKCGACGTVIEDGTYHYYTEEETLTPTCKSKGEITYTCTCGHSYTEEIDFLDHSPTVGGEENVHEKCGSCGDTLKDGNFHNYESEETKTPTCTELGTRMYTCGCGYSYTEDIAKEEHIEVGGGESGIHKKCNVCGTVIEDGTYHYYTEEETLAATCTEKGEMTYSCTCGHSYTEEIDALGHKKSDANASVTTCERCGAEWVDIDEANFEDVTFRTKLGQFDTNNDGCLIGEELTGITSVSVAGTTAMDGACKNLKGIELLPNVTQIDCSYNADLLTLDFSNNTKLYKLYCNNTGVQSINISGCTGLSTFDFTNCNQLTEMNVSETTLTSLIINSNPALTTLNMEGASFSNISLSGTQVTSVEIDDMKYLQSVTVTDTPVESVVINDSRIEGSLTLNAISQLQSVVVTNTEIYDIYANGCSGLKTLSVEGSNGNVSFENSNNIETLKLSGVKLYSLELPGATYTKLKSLDVSNCDSLQTVDVSDCVTLTNIDITNNTQLGKLIANNSGISSLDTTGCTYLSELYLNSTQIASMGDITVPYEVLIAILEISSDSSSDINIAFNAEDITWFDMIEVLDLTNAKISDSDWATIKSALRTDRISSITLSGNNSANSNDYLTKVDLRGLSNVRQIEIEELTDVTEIDISNTSISQIDISGFTNLKTFNAASSTISGSLNASSNEMLESIDVSYCMNLEELVMNDYTKTYSLSSVNIVGCSGLTQFTLLGCANITNIDFSEVTNLTSVGLTNCPGITSVDFTNNSELTSVTLEGLGITSLDLFGKPYLKTVNVSLCTSLTSIDLGGTPVESLMLTGCTGLTTVGAIDVRDNTNSSQTMEVDITGTSITEDIFEKSDGFTITLVTQ